MRTVGVLAYDETRVAQVHTKVVMQRVAAPMVGGVVTSFVLELLIYPVLFTLWKRWRGFDRPHKPRC